MTSPGVEGGGTRGFPLVAADLGYPPEYNVIDGGEGGKLYSRISNSSRAFENNGGGERKRST